MTFCTLPLIGQKSFKSIDKNLEIGKVDKAIQALKKILDKDQQNAGALSRLGQAYMESNDAETAQLWFEKAYKTGQMDPAFLTMYARNLTSLARYNDALDVWKNNSVSDPTMSDFGIKTCEYALNNATTSDRYHVKAEYINSNQPEWGAAFLGNKVVYISYADEKSKKLSDKHRIWLSKTDLNGFLIQGGVFKKKLSKSESEGPVYFNKEGNKLIFTTNNFSREGKHVPGPHTKMSIFFADLDSKGNWKNILAFPYNGNNSSCGYPMLTDENILYFASNKPGGLGGWDIYRSQLLNNKWTTPENLGPTVNTAGNEISPFVLESKLYFASDSKLGFGGYDIFVSEMTQGKCKESTNVGRSINSSADDYGLIYSTEYNKGYFTSNRLSGPGKEDIYRFEFSTNNLMVKVIDAGTLEPIEGILIDAAACNHGTCITDRSGQCYIQSNEPKPCKIKLVKEGYATLEEEITPSSKAGAIREIKMSNAQLDLHGSVVDSRGLGIPFVTVGVNAGGQQQILETESDGHFRGKILNSKSVTVRLKKAGFVDTTLSMDVRPEMKMVDFANIVILGEGEKSVKEILTSTPIDYQIQVASMKGNLEELPKQMRPIRDLGTVDLLLVEGATKIILTGYTSQQDADAALAAVKKLGYTGAFYARKPKNAGGPSVIPVSNKKKEETTVPGTPPAKPVTPPVIEANSKFRVRLGAFSKPNATLINSLISSGKLVEESKGALKIIFIELDQPGIAAAKTLQQLAVQKGFADAYIESNNGTAWSKVK